MPNKSVFNNGGFIGRTTKYANPLLYRAVPSFVVATTCDLSTGASFSYPAGIQKDDLIIIAQSSDEGTFTTLPIDSSTTTYTSHLNNSGGGPSYLISYKFADGSESGSNVTLQRISNNGAAVIQIFRNIDMTTPFDVSSTTVGSDALGDNKPNPPAITPVTDNCIIVAFGFLDDDSGVTVTAPTGYTNLSFVSSSSGVLDTNSTTMVASKFLATAALENPSNFDTSTSDSWRAVTSALRPRLTSELPYPEFTFVDSSTATNSPNIVVPSTARVGDLAIIMDNVDTSASALTIPSGWTQISSQSIASSLATAIYYKILTASDVGATVTSTNASTTDHFMLCAVFRPNSTELLSATVNVLSQQITGSGPTSRTINLTDTTTLPKIGFYVAMQRGSNNTALNIVTVPNFYIKISGFDESNREVMAMFFLIYNVGFGLYNSTGDLDDAGEQSHSAFNLTFTYQSKRADTLDYNSGIWNLNSILDGKS